MRIQCRRLKKYPFFKTVQKKDSEASTYTEQVYKGNLSMILYGMDGKVNAEKYGQELKYMKQAKVDGKYTISKTGNRMKYTHESGLVLEENDCISIIPNSTTPDYKIISIIPERHLFLELKKL